MRYAPVRAYATTVADPARSWEVVREVTSCPDHLETFASVRHVGGLEPWTVGSRFEVRRPGLLRAVYEVAEWTASSFVRVARSAGVVTMGRHRVSSAPDGARLDLEVEWTGLLAGLTRALVGRRAQGMIEREASTFARAAVDGGWAGP